MLKIVFMGTPDFARVSLEKVYEAGYKIEAVVTNVDKPKGRGMKLVASPVKEFAEEMELCNKVLTDISYWLLESVYGIPKDKLHTYYIKDGEVKVRRGIPKKRYPSAMPRELNTEKFGLILQKIMESGFCVRKELKGVFCYRWVKSKASLAYFADKCTEALGLSSFDHVTKDGNGKEFNTPTTNFSPFEELFGIKKNSLRKFKNNYGSSTRGFPRGYEQIDAVFEGIGY